MPLQTRNVFIDTQYYVSNGLDFSKSIFESFVEACSKGDLVNITTNVVKKEVERKIVDSIKVGIGGLREFQRKAKALSKSKNKVIRDMFNQVDEQAVVDEALEHFANYLDESSCTVIDVSIVPASEVFEIYFSVEPPFKTGKKSEFPDAFTLKAIQKHIGQRGEIYVVSGDTDLLAYCEANPSLICVQKLEEVLGLYTAHDDERADFINQYFEHNERQILDEIIMRIENADAYNYSTWEDSEIVNFKIIDKPTSLDFTMIQLTDHSCKLVGELEVRFSVTVVGPDFVNGRYDREDDMIYTFDETERNEEEELAFTFEIELDFEVDDGKFVAQGLTIDTPDLASGIEFSVEETGWEDPRY